MNMTENNTDNFVLAGEIAAETVISSSEVDFYNDQDSCTSSIRMNPIEYLKTDDHTDIKTNNDVLWQKIEGQQGLQDNINDPPGICHVPTEQLALLDNQEKGLTMASKRERNKVKKREQRLNPEFREKERIKARERMKERREDTRYRDCERQKDRERRKQFRKRMNNITILQGDLNFVQNGHIYLESNMNVEQPLCEIDQSHQGFPSDMIDHSHQGYASDIIDQSKQRNCTIDNNSQLDQLCENSITNNDQSLHIQYESDQTFISVSTSASGRTIPVENQYNLSEVYS
ncbi:hypothetical protein SNE40_021916 [Patella caerulea]|uniref:Uncharacterized protein n=1 Tax=Patella caerulea TaxID=87958 RepID=A0AAN8IZH4_PATCE